ncbi:hypothetical protein M406DRAFT_358152 [Cryphonectria parasitica EP155]|uniref:Mediator of RNA polymerase II transcription subunit 7 n=1 Tax=Cryphonectria parasitica (strain ATCC 38755 / EP155) TaxID=660469 RepID=A0A9P4XW68_CRYP1|nr:uncharacterized protein M406DRAFT_358152 [Cryphonectria parasitica EP155]KAF3761937.1 hypothetical protein M406DRAFT_358152 [Cryphonectria parasitica EP155]
MADQAQTAATFPNPPDFLWRGFTTENVARFEEAKKTWEEAHPEAASSKTVTLIPDLPEDLRQFQPPPEPTDGRWRMLGDPWQLEVTVPDVEEWNIRRLEPAPRSDTTSLPAEDTNRDLALNLKRLAKSALLNFLEFAGVASVDPDGLWEKTTDIEHILINMHSGINKYRPHQARESLIQTMQNRLDQLRAETAAVNAVTDKAKRVLEGLGSIDAPGESQELQEKGIVDEIILADDASEVWEESTSFN